MKESVVSRHSRSDTPGLPSRTKPGWLPLGPSICFLARGLLLQAAAACTLACAAQAAQAAGGDITIVLTGRATPYRQAEEGFRARMAKLGHKSRSIMLEELLRDRSHLRRGDDAFVAIGTKAAAWLRQNLDPAVVLGYCMTADPAPPAQARRRRTCGVSTSVPLAAQFQLIREALPATRAVGMLYRAKTPKGAQLLERARAALPKPLRLEAVAIDRHESVAMAIKSLLARDVDVVWTAPDASVYDVATVRSLLLMSIRKRVPVFGFSAAFVRAGALVGVGIDPRDQGRQAADVVHRLLRQGSGGATTRPEAGSRRADFHPPPKFQVAVNLTAAHNLGITVPQKLTKRAAHVFGKE